MFETVYNHTPFGDSLFSFGKHCSNNIPLYIFNFFQDSFGILSIFQKSYVIFHMQYKREVDNAEGKVTNVMNQHAEIVRIIFIILTK